MVTVNFDSCLEMLSMENLFNMSCGRFNKIERCFLNRNSSGMIRLKRMFYLKQLQLLGSCSFFLCHAYSSKKL